ncbi:MAG: hypothetical protein IPM54_38650 [Polyangiaceae bacterium]|nr:hypothetical protein [Polyangiaceae bacterium]
MAGIKTLPLNATTDTAEHHYSFTSVRIRRHPLTKALIAETDAFRSQIDAAIAEERSLVEAEMEAGAAVHFADRDLDDSATFVAANTDSKSPLGKLLFGGLRPSEFRRPILNSQLEIMVEWPQTLAQSDKEILKDHVPLLAGRLETATTAANEKKQASQKLAEFRAIGTRAKLNEAFNAFRKSLYGKLGDIQHANASLGAGWAESFFLQDASDEPTIAELDRKIAGAEADLAAWKKQRDVLQAQQDAVAAARAAAARKEKEAKLEALRKAQEDMAAQAAALEAELEQG